MNGPFMYTLNGVGPVLLMIVLGYMLKLTGFLGRELAKGINRLCFGILLPCSLFKNIANTQVDVPYSVPYVAFAIGCIFVEIALAILIAKPLFRERKRAGSFVQGVYRGNFVLLGLSIAGSLFGDEGVAYVTMLMPWTIAIYNALAVIILDVYSRENDRSSIRIAPVLLGIIKNPLIIATLTGTAFKLLRIPLPQFIMTGIGNLGSTATPMALIVLGAQFDPKGFRRNLFPVSVACVLRLAVFPALFCLIALLVGFKGTEVGVLFLLFGVPTAVSSHIMAINQGCDGDLAGDILVATTALSLCTLFVGVLILRATGVV